MTLTLLRKLIGIKHYEQLLNNEVYDLDNFNIRCNAR